MKLLKCNTCGKIYKVTTYNSGIYENNNFIKYYFNYITDMGGEIDKYNDTIKCLNCGEYTPYEIMEVEDWVADLVFKVKGS